MTTEPFTFRRAKRDDLEAIIALLADDDLGQSRERVSTPVDPAYLSAFDAIQSDPNQYLAILEDDAGVAGCLQISFIPACRAWACGAVRSKAFASPGVGGATGWAAP
jgi:N-acetylglutamate synthase-like GNAT family acetyltransferase